MRSERDRLEQEIRHALSTEKAYTPELSADEWLAIVKPTITRKAAELKQARKRKREMLLVGAGYIVFLTLAALYGLEYVVHGLSASIVSLLAVLGGLSVISFCCLPLFIALSNPSKLD